MKISCVLVVGVAAVVALVLSPDVLAQTSGAVTPSDESTNFGFIAWMKNIITQFLFGVQFILTIAASVGVYFGLAAWGTWKSNMNDQGGQPNWKKFFGELGLACVLLGGGGTLMAMTTSLHGANVQEGAGQVVRDRYQGTGN